MTDYSLRIAHDHAAELREARRTSRRTKKRPMVAWRRITPRPTTE